MTANPGIYDFQINKSAPFTRIFTYYSPGMFSLSDIAAMTAAQMAANLTPIDLTTYTATFHAKPSLTYATNTISKTPALGGAAGTVTLTLSAADTAALNDDALVYALNLIDGSNNPVPFLAGAITVSSLLI